MKCSVCEVAPFKYEGSGHRMLGYPYREETVAVWVGCNCETPTFERDIPSPEKVAGAKAKLERRINSIVDKYIAENASDIIARWCSNDLERVYWMTDEQWAHIEKERAR